MSSSTRRRGGAGGVLDPKVAKAAKSSEQAEFSTVMSNLRDERLIVAGPSTASKGGRARRRVADHDAAADGIRATQASRPARIDDLLQLWLAL